MHLSPSASVPSSFSLLPTLQFSFAALHHPLPLLHHYFALPIPLVLLSSLPLFLRCYPFSHLNRPYLLRSTFDVVLYSQRVIQQWRLYSSRRTAAYTFSFSHQPPHLPFYQPLKRNLQLVSKGPSSLSPDPPFFSRYSPPILSLQLREHQLDRQGTLLTPLGLIIAPHSLFQDLLK